MRRKLRYWQKPLGVQVPVSPVAVHVPVEPMVQSWVQQGLPPGHIPSIAQTLNVPVQAGSEPAVAVLPLKAVVQTVP
jgi:hypothetical protein